MATDGGAQEKSNGSNGKANTVPEIKKELREDESILREIVSTCSPSFGL